MKAVMKAVRVCVLMAITISSLAVVNLAHASTAGLTEYPIPTSGGTPLAITNGPDGNLWFVENTGDKIGKITPAGQITEYPVPSQNTLFGITAGPDGALWFTESYPGQIGRIATDGTVSEFPVDGSHLRGITAGADGYIYFAESGDGMIGQLNPKTGQVVGQFDLTTNDQTIDPQQLVAGPDGNIWFTSYFANAVGELDPATGGVTLYPLNPGDGALGIAVGPDNNIWFTVTGSPGCNPCGNYVGKITTSGALHEYLPGTGGSPSAIIAGPDGAIWFMEQTGNYLARMTTSGVITAEIPVSSVSGMHAHMAVGPDGALWFPEQYAGKIGKLIPSPPGPATHFRIGVPNKATAGKPFTVTVTALDANNNVATGYTGTAFFETTDHDPAINSETNVSPNVIFTADMQGVYSFQTQLYTAGSQTISAYDLYDPTINGTSPSIAVSPASVNQIVLTGPSTATAGTPASYTVTARDLFGNTATSYTSQVLVTSWLTAGGASVTDYPSPNPVAISSGSGQFSVTFHSVGAQTVKVQDGSVSTLHDQMTTSVSPGALDHFAFTVPATATAGSAIQVTAVAKDSSGNDIPTYSGTVQVTSSDVTAQLPAPVTFVNSTRSFWVTLNTAGPQTLSVTDSGAGVTSTTDLIDVAAAPLPPSGPAATKLAVSSAGGTYGGTTSLSATLTSGGTTLSGKTITFSLNGTAVCGGTTGVPCPATDSSGTASLSQLSLSGIAAGRYTGAVTASYAGSTDYAASTGSGDLSVSKAPLTITAQSQSVQYSDSVNLAASAATYGSGKVWTANFVNGDDASALTTLPTCFTTAQTSNNQVLSPAGAYGIICSGGAGPNYTTDGVAAVPSTLTVSRESTTVRPAQNNPSAVQVSKPNGSAPAVTVTARITEEADGSYGDITRVTPVTFTLAPIGSGGSYTCQVPSAGGSVTQSVAATGTTPGFEVVSCTFPAGIAVNVYDLTTSVGGQFYTGSADSALTVYDPSQSGTASGSGLVVNPTTGNTVSFGFSATYSKNGSVSGKMVYVETDAAGNQVALLKGNNLATMAVTSTNSTTPRTVTLTGKGVLNGVGNYSYIVTTTDMSGTSNDGDKFGIQVRDPTGNPVAARSFNPQLLLTNSGSQIGDIAIK